jgi:thymidylate synthase (FAD)
MKIVEPSVELLWSTPQAEQMIELAGRTCYKSEPKVFSDCMICHGTGKVWTDLSLNKQVIPQKVELDCESCSKRSSREFIQKILKSGHESVLEHASASMKIICDRGVSHEIVRHRTAFSYSQESSRYCNYSADKFGSEITVIKPHQFTEEFIGQQHLPSYYSDWEESMKFAEASYLKLLKAGMSAQNARSVLPTCLKTELVITANVRSWRNFIKLRLSSTAHPDMQIVAGKIFQILNKIFPNCFNDLKYT